MSLRANDFSLWDERYIYKRLELPHINFAQYAGCVILLQAGLLKIHSLHFSWVIVKSCVIQFAFPHRLHLKEMSHQNLTSTF